MECMNMYTPPKKKHKTNAPSVLGNALIPFRSLPYWIIHLPPKRRYTPCLCLRCRAAMRCEIHPLPTYLPGQTKFPPMPKPAPKLAPLDSLTGLLATVPWALTPATMRSRFVSITTPPTIISLRAA